MKIELKYRHWLICCLTSWLLFALFSSLSTNTAAASIHDFPFSEPEFETLYDLDAIDKQTIYAIEQDVRGLIWIGTTTGLVRYDGYRFRKFVHKTGDPFSLAGDFIYALLASQDGRIWVGTVNDGISIFDPSTERFENLRHDDKVPSSLSGGTVRAFAHDGQGGIWIGTAQGLDHLPMGSKRFTHFKNSADPNSLIDDKIRSLLRDKTGRLWVGSDSGLQRLNKNKQGFETIVSNKSVGALFQAQDGKLWLGTRNHGAAWLASDDIVHWLPLKQLSHPWVVSITQVQTNQIWLGTYGGGINIVAAVGGHLLQTLRHDPALPSSLTQDLLGILFMDRAGWLWLGGEDGGLQRTNANNTMTRTIRHSPKRTNGLSHPVINYLLELADGKLLFGSVGNGVDIFDRQKGLIGGYRSSPDKADTDALPDATVNAMAQTSDGTIWVSTQQSEVVRKRPGSTEWVPLPNVLATFMFVSRDESLWIGTATGVVRWRAQNHLGQASDQFENFPDEQGRPMRQRFNAMAEDAQGRLWIGTNNGLWVHEPGSPYLLSIPAEPNRPDGLISSYISDLLFDSKNRLWIATDKGLERLKSLNGRLAQFEHINTLFQQAPPSLKSTGLLEDFQGRIWTESGVIEPAPNDPTKLRISPISNANGINMNAFSPIARIRDGLLLYGGAEGVAIIDPANFKPYTFSPPLVITELKINGEAMAPASLAKPVLNALNAADSLTLEPKQRNFALEFAALDYAEPRKNRYQYRLQGYDKSWINADANHRNAAYGNLWPGQYTLQIRGSNSQGQWSQHELTIPILVLPAWWQTWWFGLVLLLLSLSSIIALVQVRTRFLRQRQHELAHLIHQRTSQLREKQSQLLQSNEALNQSNVDLLMSVQTLRQLGDVGREITAHLDAETVFQSLYQYVGQLLDAPAMGIYRMNTTTSALDAVFGRDGNQIMPTHSIALDSATSIAVRAVHERQELLQHFDPQIVSLNHLPGTRQMLTALFAPLIVDEQVLGVISIQSDKQNAYGERERLIFRTLTAYGAIALANAASVAALHHAQEQLLQQEKMASLGGLVAGIAHEINTPLGNTLVAISGVQEIWLSLQQATYSGRLNKSILDSSTSEGLEYTTLALKTATRAAELVTLFKTISVDSHQDQASNIELSTYLSEVAALVKAPLAYNGCQLAISVTQDLRIYVVPEALTEALSRILVNTLDHAFTDGRTGTLQLSARAATKDDGIVDGIVITISDNGHGIAPENLPKVFDPFFTTKSGIQGHIGLGLNVAYNHITQRLKGQIKITSTLGEGTQIEIRLKNHDILQNRTQKA